MYLSNWQIWPCREGYFTCGNVFGNPQFKNNTRITTSLIERIAVDNNKLIIKTLNSIYEAYFSELDFSLLNEAKAAIKKLANEEDFIRFSESVANTSTLLTLTIFT